MASTEAEPQQDTKHQIIDVAQRLFAEDGFETVSLRHITAEAGVNVAAVNYHFGSKEGLIDAVVERRIRPVNEERLRLLDELEVEFGEEAPPLGGILRALLSPLLTEFQGSALGEQLFYKLMGRCLSDRGMRLPEPVVVQFHEVVRRFCAVVRRGHPELSEQEVVWRLHFTAGVLIQTLIHSEMVEQITEEGFGTPNAEEVFDHMVAFCAAGFSAPARMDGGKGRGAMKVGKLFRMGAAGLVGLSGWGCAATAPGVERGDDRYRGRGAGRVCGGIARRRGG